MENSSDEQYSEIELNKKIQRDIEYIQNDILAKQVDGNYIKWSKALNATAIVGLTGNQYYDYWEKQYKSYPEHLDQILEVCTNKLINGLTPPQVMIDMIQNSSDCVTEKEKAIKLLGGKYVRPAKQN